MADAGDRLARLVGVIASDITAPDVGVLAGLLVVVVVVVVVDGEAGVGAARGDRRRAIAAMAVGVRGVGRGQG